MDLELLATRLRDARKLRKRTLDDVAASVGMNKSTIQRYEKACIQSPKMPVLREIAHYLDVNVLWLTGDVEEMEQPQDEEDMEHYLSMLETRPEVRALLKSVDKAKPEDVKAVMDFFTALRTRV